MKRYRVRVADDAERDLIDIYNYIAVHDSPQNADDVLNDLESTCSGLAELPLRGHVPPELDRIGVTTYLEVQVKPWRIIYEVTGRHVLVHCVADGRRDMLSLFERRLLR